MIIYKPQYDTTIHTTTVVTKENTLHTCEIDWDNYPFDDPEHVSGMCCRDAEKAEHIAQLKEWLRLCERCKERDVLASNYGGWPRIWHKVLRVGMGSCWPYWRPRPVVIVEGTLCGLEFYDWTSLTGAKLKEAR